MTASTFLLNYYFMFSLKLRSTSAAFELSTPGEYTSRFTQ